MIKVDFGNFKYLGLISALNITFLLVSNFTAAKVVTIFGMGASVAIYYFPITYLLSDILTEVYGYARARSIVWLSIFCSIIAALLSEFAALVPAAPFFADGEAYKLVLSSTPRIAIAGWVAVFVGDIANNYVLAKMKVWNKGKHLWARLVGSTIIGEGINSILFFVGAFYGVLSNAILVQTILVGWILKTLVEVVLMPVSYKVIAFLKKVENEDYYDYNTNFNPLILSSGSEDRA